MPLLSLLTVCIAAIAVPAIAGDEIYIANSGAGMVVLRQEDQGLTVPESVLFVKHFSRSSWLTAERRDDALTVTAVSRERGPHSTMSLVRSRSVPGDYDLIAMCGLTNDKETSCLETFGVSFLHRLDDPRLVRYFAIPFRFDQSADPAELAELATLGEQVAQAHPDDLFVRLVYWDSLIRTTDVGALEKELETFRSRFAAGTRSQRRYYALTADELASLQSSLAGRNSWDIVDACVKGRLDLNSTVQSARQFVLKPDFIPRRGGLVALSVPSFLAEQMIAKIVRMQATLLLFRGEFGQARDALLGIYRLGQMMAAQSTDLHSLIGSAIRAIAIGGLDLYVQNACHTPDELAYVMNWLNWMTANPPKSYGTSESLIALKGEGVDRERPTAEQVYRSTIVDARFELLRSAIATRYVLLKDQRFPLADDFAPLLPQGLPKDPFAKGPLRVATSPGESPFTIYSIGPDQRDDHAELEYDSTNGTVSPGDVLTRIPRQPKYPFPPAPMRAGSPQQVVQQFPGGLPPDLFADKRGQPLPVCPTIPVRIYSVGPDLEPISSVREDPNQAPYIPGVLYDPTNGLMSHGDLFVDILPR